MADKASFCYDVFFSAILFFCISNIWSDNITLTAYYGGSRTRHYYILKGRYDMTEGTLANVCQGRGNRLLTGITYRSQFQLLRETLVVHNNWSSYENIWIPIIKYPSVNGNWLSVDTCKETNLFYNITTAKYPDEFAECSIINMSKEDDRNSLISTSCHGKHSIICYEDSEENSITEVLNMSFVPVSNLFVTHTYNVTSDDCRSKLYRTRKNAIIRFVMNDYNSTKCSIGKPMVFSEPAIFNLINDTEAGSTLSYKSIPSNVTVVPEHETNTESYNTSLPCAGHLATGSQVTESFSSNTASTGCCTCIGFVQSNKSEEEIQIRIEQIRSNLTVQKTELSSHKRTKSSAPDDRPSSTTIGSVGVAVLIFVGICVVIIDLNEIKKGLKQARANLYNR